jgi:hypothetical protein
VELRGLVSAGGGGEQGEGGEREAVEGFHWEPMEITENQ